MKLHVKKGVDELLFGMKQKDVEALYGKPDRTYEDDEDNIIYLYNDKKLALTFYEDEDFKLGYISVSHTEASVNGISVIGKNWDDVEPQLKQSGIKAFDNEAVDTLEHYFNEDNWVIFVVEFNEIVKVELGAVINDDDEFEWQF